MMKAELLEAANDPTLSGQALLRLGSTALWYIVEGQEELDVLEPAEVLLDRADTKLYKPENLNYRLLARTYIADIPLFACLAIDKRASVKAAQATHGRLAILLDQITNIPLTDETKRFALDHMASIAFSMFLTRRRDDHRYMALPVLPAGLAGRWRARPTDDTLYPTCNNMIIRGQHIMLPSRIRARAPNPDLYRQVPADFHFVDLSGLIGKILRYALPAAATRPPEGMTRPEHRLRITVDKLLQEAGNKTELQDDSKIFLNALGSHLVSGIELHINHLAPAG